MMLSKAKHGMVSFLVCFALFFIILFFGHPIFNSGDDVYLLYLLAGGFGDPPINLLHYNFGMHPWLGWLIKTLFSQSADINWYSFVLYTLHFISCWVLLKIFFATKKFYEAILFFLLVFFVFEVQFLLNLTFSNTALLTAMAGILLLLHESSKTISDKKIIATAIALIAISTMLRLHTLIPLALIALPIILFRLLQKRFLLFYSIFIACIVIFFLNYFQQQYYSHKIADWKTEESYRQTVLSYYNIPKSSQSDIASAFLNNGLFWDKEFLSAAKIQEVNQRAEISSVLIAKKNSGSLHWMFINNRIFLLALLFISLITIFRSYKTTRILNLSGLLVMLSLLAYLLLFKKLPFYLIPALILFYILLTIILPEKENNSSHQFYSINKIVTVFIFIAVLAWSAIRIQKTISFNKEKNALFVCAWKELDAHREKLFIATDDHFPLDYFSVWDSPKKFVIKNLLYKDQLLNNTYQPIYNRFSITSPKDFINSPAIFFAGKKIIEIEDYYKTVWKTDVHFTQKDSNFICSEVYQLKF
jgi:hypothetical protein